MCSTSSKLQWVQLDLGFRGGLLFPSEAKIQLIRDVAALIPPLQRSGGIRAGSHLVNVAFVPVLHILSRIPIAQNIS
jgi:hypothetical protein